MAFLFWVFVLAVFCGACLISLVVFVIGWRKKNRTLKYLGGVPFGILASLGTFFCALFLWSLIATDNPRNVYQDTFGFAPSSDVANLNSSYFMFGDSASTYLYFKASPATIKRIAANGLKRIPSSQYDSYLSDAPSWWKPRVTKTTQIFVSSHHGGASSTETEDDETLLYDPATRDAYYSYIGID